MSRQLSMLEPAKRKPPQKLMHVYDAGYLESGLIAHFRCQHCGYDSGWIKADGVAQAKRGRPCPECNGL